MNEKELFDLADQLSCMTLAEFVKVGYKTQSTKLNHLLEQSQRSLLQLERGSAAKRRHTKRGSNSSLT